MIVYSVFWGDKYSPDYVPRLRDQVHKHLTIPHEFRCITEHEFWDVDTVEPVCDYPGWWAKLGLFKPGAFAGPSLYLDLDVSIVGNLNGLITNSSFNGIHCAKNWAQSGHGGIQSSVLYWWAGMPALAAIWNDFDPEWAVWPPRNEPGVLWGDQEHLTKLRDEGKLRCRYFDPEHVVSYKYHCRANGLPDNARVVCFHGDPKPHEVKGYF